MDMDLEELRGKSFIKELVRGKSGRGKTYAISRAAIDLSKEGLDVMYADTESEGAMTLLKLVETGGYKEGDIRNIHYEQTWSYEDVMGVLSTSNQKRYDVIVLDTLDHKHTYAINSYVEEASDTRSDVDWSEWTAIHDLEKQMMEKISKPKTNIIATIDPDSGKMEKPKGVQTNVHGYFNLVVDMMKNGDDDWSHIVRNYVCGERYIGKTTPNVVDLLKKEIVKRTV